MEQAGYREGTDIVLESRSADGKPERLEALAADLVRSRPDAIVAHDTAAVLAAKKATNRIPIIMAPAADPASAGLVASLARPAGNVTGLATNGAQVADRILQLIREMKANARRIAVLANADDPSVRGFLATLNQAAARIRVPIGVARVRTAADYEATFAQWERLRLQAVIVHSSVNPVRAAELALSYRFPSIAVANGFVQAGGLMSYSESPRDLGRKAAGYVDRVLKGAKPAELPVEQLSAFDLALNLRTAKRIELELPDTLLARADALIQ